MGLFGSGKIKTLTYCVYLFVDDDHPAPKTANAQNDFGVKFIPELVKKHYYEELKPPKKWNYYCGFLPLDFSGSQGQAFDFRDSKSRKISSQAKYAELCNHLKDIWKERLMTVYPKYDRNNLEESLENAQFDYFPDKCVLIISSIMPGLVQSGSEEFKNTSMLD